MKYLILHENSIEKAKEISAKIWRMTMPNTEGNVTQYYTGWIQHPDGRVAIQVLGEASSQEVNGETVWSFSDSMPIHPEADENGMADAIDGGVTPSEKANIKAGLTASKGKSASLLAFAMQTPSLAKRLKTREQMEADGWFPTPDLP